MNKIGRIRRKPTFIIKQINWLKSITDDNRIKDSKLKQEAVNEMSRLGVLLTKQIKKKEKNQKRKELPFDDTRYLHPEDGDNL